MFFFQKNTGGCFCGKFRGGKRQVNKTGNMKFVSRASATSKNVFCVFFDDVLVCAHLFFSTLARAGNASFARARALGCAHRTPGARTQRVSLAPHTLTPPPRAHTHTTALARHIHLSHTHTHTIHFVCVAHTIELRTHYKAHNTKAHHTTTLSFACAHRMLTHTQTHTHTHRAATPPQPPFGGKSRVRASGKKEGLAPQSGPATARAWWVGVPAGGVCWACRCVAFTCSCPNSSTPLGVLWQCHVRMDAWHAYTCVQTALTVTNHLVESSMITF